MTFDVMKDLDPLNTVIKVIGVGGGGGNAVDYMVTQNAQGVEFIVANTDYQALQHSKAHVKLQLGETGLGAGAKPEIGAQAAWEKREQIEDAIRGSNLLFITAGMGGGTGTGAAPVIAEIAKEMGILTVGVVTRPFSFEGARRANVAQEGLSKLRDKVDSMLVILNSKLEEIDPEATMKQCYAMSNDVLYKACVGIADIIHTPGYINLDFEDVKTVMSIRGSAIIGLASRSGPNRAVEAAEAAISCPLLEGRNIEGAGGLLVYFTCDDTVTMAEMRKAMGVLNTFVSKNAQVFWGSANVPEMNGEIRVTIVATGLDEVATHEPPPIRHIVDPVQTETQRKPPVINAPLVEGLTGLPAGVIESPVVTPEAPVTPVAPVEAVAPVTPVAPTPVEAAPQPAPTPAPAPAPEPEPEVAPQPITIPSFLNR